MTSETVIQTPTLPPKPVPEMDAIITTHNLTKAFGQEVAVRDVSFQVPRGQIFGFIGPSGSGKTTTIRMLTGFYPPTSGEAYVFGSAPTKFTKGQRGRIGYMPQLFVMYPNLSVWENLNFSASIYGMSWFSRRRKLREMLEFVELREHKDKLARDVSGGMQRRLSLASTLIHDPELIFLDEPTAGIDPVLRSKIWDRFRELRDAGRTLFVTTQYVSEAAYCDLVGVISESQLIAVDTPDGLRHRAFGGDIVALTTTERLDYRQESEMVRLPFIVGRVTRTGPQGLRMVVDDAATAIPALMNWGQEHNIAIQSIEEYQPPFDDVFVELVQEEE